MRCSIKRFKQKTGCPTFRMIVFSCVGFVFFVCWIYVVDKLIPFRRFFSYHFTSFHFTSHPPPFSWWGRRSWNRLISLIHLSSCNSEMGSPQDLFCLPIGSFPLNQDSGRVRCLLLEYHPFKRQSRWGTMGTAPYALVELKQGPNFPNLCRGYLLQKLSTLNLNIPTKQDKEKEHQSQFSSQFSEGCYLRQLLKTTCLLSSHVDRLRNEKTYSSVEYVNVAWSMTDVVGTLFQAQTITSLMFKFNFWEYRCGSVNG